MALSDLLDDLRRDPGFMAGVMTWHTQPARPAQPAPTPAALHPLLQRALAARAIDALYTHQATAVELALAGENVVVVTPTASGKTLCYNLPVLHSLLTDPEARALYLFPTKALAHDQLAEVRDFVVEIGRLEAGDTERLPTDVTSPNLPISQSLIATYDGDTPSSQRAAIRREARILLTNPDMLHTGILPFHGNWAHFWAGLRTVVIDELHVYRGVFGSHVANVLRRLQRICRTYGSTPRFVLTSATIANPQDLAQRLVEQPVHVVDQNGAPQGEKHIILYNPPVYDPERGLRRSSTLEAQELATRAISAGVQTIVFGRSRLTTELLLTYIRDSLGRRSGASTTATDPATAAVSPATAQPLIPTSAVRGYRGGYLPSERRAIEAGLRSGEVRGVVATNALELGIDIGRLGAAILCGYPGNIASTWQQMGRAGRTRDAALALLVATGGALDQYVIQHPEYIFEQSPEHALINPDNLMLLVDQIRCAAFELPFAQDERFGASPITAAVLQLLAEEGDVMAAGPRWVWSGPAYPAQQVSLRSAGSDSVVVEAEGDGTLLAIGEMDPASAQMLAHDGAIYLHEGQSYTVQRLNMEERHAHVVPVRVDYYTDAMAEVAVDVLATHATRSAPGVDLAHGELLVSTQVVGFRRVKRFTHETLGVYPLDYPPSTLDTTGYWFSITPGAQLALARQGQWFDSVNNYGPNWQEQRARVRARDRYQCSRCNAPEPTGRQHDVHHLIPFRTFGYVSGVNEHYRLANRLENLVLVCRSCHQRLEAAVRTRSGLDGLAYALSNLAPLHLMCDRANLSTAVMRGRALDAAATPATTGHTTDLPTVYLFERIAAGLGFSARLYELHEDLLAAAAALVAGCPCATGCPACVGPVLEHEQASLETKQLTRAMLDVLTGTHSITGAQPPIPPTATDSDIRF